MLFVVFPVPAVVDVFVLLPEVVEALPALLDGLLNVSVPEIELELPVPNELPAWCWLFVLEEPLVVVLAPSVAASVALAELERLAESEALAELESEADLLALAFALCA